MSTLGTLSFTSDGWEHHAADLLEDLGFFVLKDGVPASLAEQSLAAAYAVRDRVRAELGEEKLQLARDNGDNAVRLPFCYDPVFLKALSLESVHRIIEVGLDRAAVLRFLHAAIAPPVKSDPAALAQHAWHRNFSEHPAGDRLTLEVVISLRGHEREDGMLRLAPGTHRRAEKPSDSYLHRHAHPIRCMPGDLFVMDSRLWHREPENRDDCDHVSIGCQFARHYVKPNFDHFAALGADRVASLPERTQYLLGSRTRPPSSLEEFYVPAGERLYRPLSR